MRALNTFYRVPLEEGQAVYGPRFVNNHYQIACHNSKGFCLNGPDQSLTVHSAFVYWAEENLRMIDPSNLVLPYWDFMVSVQIKRSRQRLLTLLICGWGGAGTVWA